MRGGADRITDLKCNNKDHIIYIYLVYIQKFVPAWKERYIFSSSSHLLAHLPRAQCDASSTLFAPSPRV